MRQPKDRLLGDVGVSAVELAFKRVGWGATTAPESDVGTDLYLFVTDSRLFDPGLLAGAQVKAGDSYFEEPVYDEVGALLGWWFRDSDRRHIDSWLVHSLPHLIVLHDETAQKSYWAHVTAETVQSTGKGAKVFVPVDNTIDKAHRAALLEVAATQVTRPAWEGSAWTGARELLPRDVLRHALLVPRVIAPHRNAVNSDAVSAEQVLALLVEARLHEIERLPSKHSNVPTLEQAVDSPDWTWRFVGAFGARVTTGAIDQLIPLIEAAPDPSSRAAATVVAAAALLEHARPDEALALLDKTLDRDDNLPVDHAWLTGQRARACWDIGRVDDAKFSAVAIQEIRSTHAADITATAIAGTAAMLLFNLSSWGADDVEQAITGLDTTAVWWRTQRVAAGSNAVIEREFAARVRRTAMVIFGGENVANNRLFTAALLASHAGDHREWSNIESLNAKQTLLTVGRMSDPDEASDLLTRARRAGDDKAMDLAVRQLVADGPAAAVSAAAAEIDFEHWTRSTCRPTLTLLRRGGDVLDETTASTAVRWLLATLADARAFVERTRPSFLVGPRLVDTLAGITFAAPHDDRVAAAEFILNLEARTNESAAASLVGLVHALPPTVWTAELAERATNVAGRHQDGLRLTLLSAAAPVNEHAHDQLLDEIRAGSIRALIALNNAKDIPNDVIATLMDNLEPQINRQVEDARRLSHGMSEYDAAEILARLNVHHQDQARWEPLFALLEEPQVALSAKRNTCDVLARWVDRVDPGVRLRLGEIASAIVDFPNTFVDELGQRTPGGRGAAAELAAAATGDVDLTQDLLTRLLMGDRDLRIWAARLAVHLESSTAVGVLVPLTQDEDPDVRAAAAALLVQIVATGSENSLAMAALHRCLADPGTRVPRSIANAIVQWPQTATSDDLLTGLAAHRSAAVRAQAADRLGPHPDDH